MKFITTFLLCLFLFFVIFSATVVGIMAAISFVSWTLPSYENLIAAAPVATRVILVLSTLASLGFMFSKEGRREWQL